MLVCDFELYLFKFLLTVWAVFVFALWHIPQEFPYSWPEGGYRFWTGNKVKGHRQSPTMLKIGEPELRSGKLPFHISVTLNRERAG